MVADIAPPTPAARPRRVVGVLSSGDPRDRRVPLVPSSVTILVAGGHEVLVQAGAGSSAGFPDASYAAAGAQVGSADRVRAESDVVLCTGTVPADDLHRAQTLVGMLDPTSDRSLLAAYAARGVGVLSLRPLPRTVSRAQSMDVLTSQANVAGYKAAVLAADTFAGFFPMLMTASGTVRPAAVLVLGAGVAGLQAIGTARRLGAVVHAYDVRPEARADIESVGGVFVELPGAIDATAAGGYARALTPQETAAQQRSLSEVVTRSDVVICTAQAHGRPPPVLVTVEALAQVRPGSVLVDLAASPRGGNVAGSRPGETVTTPSGARVVGADDLPSQMSAAASTAWSHNMVALLAHLDTAGPGDEILAAIVLVHDHLVPGDHAHELQPVR